MRRLSLLLILALTLGGCTQHMAPSQSDVLPAPSAPPPVSAPEETVDPSPPSLYLLRDWETSDYTVLDREGNALLPRTYDRVDRISEDRLGVAIRQPGDPDSSDFQAAVYCYALCDLSGNLLTDFQYSSMTALENGEGVVLGWGQDRFDLLDTRTGEVLASLPRPLESYLSAIDGGSYFLYSVYSPPSGKDRDAPSTYTYSLYSLDSLRRGDLAPLWTVENAGYADSSHPIDAGIRVSWGGYDGSGQGYRLMGPEGFYFSGKAYSGLQPFSEDLAAASEGGLWGYLDREGNWAIPPQFANCTDFSQGYAAVCQNGVWGYIDARGEWLVQPRYTYAYPFEQGCANCEIRDDQTGQSTYYLLDQTGKETELPGSLYNLFGQGEDYALAYSWGKQADGEYHSSLWRVNRTGEAAYIGEYDVYFQSGNTAALSCYDPKTQTSSCGLYDFSTGQWLVELGVYQYFSQFNYTAEMSFRGGEQVNPYFAGCRTEWNTQLYDLLDLDGNVILEGCNSISFADDGRAVVKKGFSQGMMDFEGNWLYKRSIFTGMGAD